MFLFLHFLLNILQFIIDGYKTDKKYYPGFGHPRYKDFDPRTKRVLEKALIPSLFCIA